MELQDIQPKQDDAQRLLALNGVPKAFWLSAEEINLILDVLATLLGNVSALYKGEHEDLQYLEAAHPLPEPGSYAQIIVVDGDNLKATWDNTNKKWFLDGIFVEPGSNAAYLLKSVYDANNDGIIDKAAAIQAVLTAGGTKYYGTKDGESGVFDFPQLSGTGTTSPTEIISFATNYQSGLSYNPSASFKENGVLKTDSRAITAAAADPTYDRFDLWAIDLTLGQIILIKGTASANPVTPDYDPVTQLAANIISIKAGATVPENVIGETMYAEGVEWALTGGPAFDFQNPESPYSGIYAIKGVTPMQSSQSMSFIPPVAKTWIEGMEITYKIKNIVGGTYRWLAQGEKSNGKLASVWMDAPFNYSTTSQVYQALSVVIPSGLVNITRITIVSYFTGLQFFLDDVKLITGGGAVTGDYVSPAQLETARLSAIAEAGTNANTAISNAEKWKGSFLNLAALQAAYPSGQTGWTADVDAGAGDPVKRYVWDVSDAVWTIQVGESTAETAASIKTKYESNLDTNAFTDALLAKINSITAIFTTALKTSYDTASSWVSTNGANVLDRLTILERAPILVSTSRLLAANDNKRKLLITATVTLTWPAGGIADFECNFDVDSTGQLTIADQATGAELDAPDGKILEAGKMAHGYKRPDNAKLRLKGTFIV